MSKSAKKAADQAEREKVHKRYSNRREPDVIYPAKKQVDFYDADIHQRVAVYVRVSTDNLGQETSYELQKNYYEEFVLKHPNWKLVKIYADKGISGTSTKHRVELNQMLTDSRAGKIDLIITKSVSRLARNTVDCITMVRNLAELRNPVGVFFESECIFSLNEDTNMPLSFLASIAENESRIRSRSIMNTRSLCKSTFLMDTQSMESRIALYPLRHPWKMSHQSIPHINQRYLCRRGV